MLCAPSRRAALRRTRVACPSAPPRVAYRTRGLVAGAALVGLPAGTLQAQTDFYNTDSGRPTVIEDAYALEYRGFEVQAAPLRLERARRGVYNWGIEPELALGIFPRTQIEVGVPLAYVDAGAAGRTSGVAGVDASVLYNFNAETRFLPALAVRGSLLLPVGELGPERTYSSVAGIVTRTLPRFGPLRVHLNGQYTFGTEPSRPADGTGTSPIGAGATEVSRWLAGGAVDYAFPLRSTLVTSELHATQPIDQDEAVQWATTVGLRRQFTVRWTTDFGVGRRLNGDDRAWYTTLGAAFAFGSVGRLPFGR